MVFDEFCRGWASAGLAERVLQSHVEGKDVGRIEFSPPQKYGDFSFREPWQVGTG